MKPFFTTSMLVEMNFSEAVALRVLVANHRNKLLGSNELHLGDEETKEFLREQIEFYNQMYRDLTAIIQSMPFEME